MIWQPKYWLLTGVSRRLPDPDVDLVATAADPGRGPVGASFGMRYRYVGAERHLMGGAMDVGLRLGGGIGLGLAGAYDPEGGLLDGLRFGMSYGTWHQRSSDGVEPGLLLGVDYDLGRSGDSRWRASAAVMPIPDLKIAWDHRFDGSNDIAASWRLGILALGAGTKLDADYGLSRWGLGLRGYDRGGWIGLGWMREGEHNTISLDMSVPIGAAASPTHR